MGELIGSSAFLSMFLWPLAVVLFVAAVPIMAFSIALNIWSVKRQLVRLNRNIESGMLAPRAADDSARGDFPQRPIRTGAGIGSLRS